MIRFFAQILIAISITVFIGFTIPQSHKDFHKKPAAGVSLSPVAFYPDHIPGAYTGGFGEETCHSCHFDYDINEERGHLTVEGIEETYSPGETYELVVSVESEHLEIGGFQMTARFEDGSQAGQFKWTGDRLILTPGLSDDIQYLQHSGSGTEPTSERKVSWTFEWVAPDQGGAPVIFNITANAGNDDFSPFGDWIYVQEITVKHAP